MRAYDALGLLIEMYLSASYDGFGSPAMVGDQVPGIPSVVTTQADGGGIEVSNWRVYREMQNLEREITMLNKRFTLRLREVRG